MGTDADGGTVPGHAPGALQLAAQAVVMEYFARIDAREIDRAAELHADDVALLGAQGRKAARDVLERGLAPSAGVRNRHVIANVRSSPTGEGAVLVRYTALAYSIDGDRPPFLRTILDQEMLVRPDRSGRLLIARHSIPGYAPAG